MTDFLEQVIRERRADVTAAQARVSSTEMRANAAASNTRIGWFHQWLRYRDRGRLAVIAEVKRISPALGALLGDVKPAELARRYEAAGARAISVLTEPRHWGGSIADLADVRAAVQIPVLCKDVIVDPYQVYEARAAGADAVLLIAEAFRGRETTLALDPATGAPLGPARESDPLHEMIALVERLGMTALVEAHEPVAFGRAVASGAWIVGVNARNLRRPTEIDVGRVRQLHTFVHPDQVLVAESGIASVDDARLLPARVDAVLLGTALMRADDPAPLIQGIASIRRTVHA